jgi:hypothetical protein
MHVSVAVVNVVGTFACYSRHRGPGQRVKCVLSTRAGRSTAWFLAHKSSRLPAPLTTHEAVTSKISDCGGADARIEAKKDSRQVQPTRSPCRGLWLLESCSAVAYGVANVLTAALSVSGACRRLVDDHRRERLMSCANVKYRRRAHRTVGVTGTL